MPSKFGPGSEALGRSDDSHGSRRKVNPTLFSQSGSTSVVVGCSQAPPYLWGREHWQAARRSLGAATAGSMLQVVHARTKQAGPGAPAPAIPSPTGLVPMLGRIESVGEAEMEATSHSGNDVNSQVISRRGTSHARGAAPGGASLQTVAPDVQDVVFEGLVPVTLGASQVGSGSSRRLVSTALSGSQ